MLAFERRPSCAQVYEPYMTRKTLILLLLICLTIIFTFVSHSRLASLILTSPISTHVLRPVPPLQRLKHHLSSYPLSIDSAARVRRVLSSALCANITAGRLPPYDPLDFREQAVRLDALMTLSGALMELEQHGSLSAEGVPDLELLASHIEQSLFPWSVRFRQPLHSLPRRTARGRGIVLTTGSEHFRYALLNIKHLAALGSHLPIEVWISTLDALPDVAINELLSLNVSVRRMESYVDTSMLQLRTFAFKPFALLLSSFEEALLLDADAFFVQPPRVLFDDPYYQAHGALFFRDALFPPARAAEKRDFLRRLWPSEADLPYRVKESAFFKGETLFEQESSVVLVHRTRAWRGLLGTAILNGWPARDYVYRQVWGDKETFWLGFALAQVPFDFSPHSPAIVGHYSSEARGLVCGLMAHVDHRGALLYWNGGVAPSKHHQDRVRPIAFQVWGAPDEWLAPGDCTMPAEAKTLTKDEQRAINGLVELWKLQQKERDRIAGFNLRVMYALLTVLLVFVVCFIVALLCWGMAGVSQLAHASGEHLTDEEHGVTSVWHRP